jgi:hypothetical protein
MACSPSPLVKTADPVACAYCDCQGPWQVKRVEERRAGNESQVVGIMRALELCAGRRLLLHVTQSRSAT